MEIKERRLRDEACQEVQEGVAEELLGHKAEIKFPPPFHLPSTQRG